MGYKTFNRGVKDGAA